MTDKLRLEFRFFGDGFDPETVKPKEIATMLMSITDMITQLVAHTYPHLSLDENDAVVGLSAITQASLDIELVATAYVTEVDAVSSIVSDAIASGDYTAFPISAIEKVEKIRAFTRAHQVRAEVWRKNGSRQHIALITPDTPIRYDTSVFRGTTTLYGTLIRVGGEDPARAKIRFLNGATLNCRVKNTKLAQRMAHRLYDQIGVVGVAVWYTRDNSLKDFRIEELLPYRKAPLSDVLKSLSDIVSPAYERIEDIASHVREIRGKDDSAL